jgi:hypothetical protein
MAITAGTLRLTTLNRAIPNVVVTSALAAAGPVAIASSGTGDGGAPPVVACTSTNRASYLGYSYQAAVPIGDQAALANGAIVEGFTGVTQGGKVYIADNGSLTHTPPATNTIGSTINPGKRVVAVAVSSLADLSATTAFNVVVPQGANTLKAARVSVKTAITANDTNYWTFALTNKGAAGDGSTAMLAASDANTTKSTGGSGITAYVARALTIHGTAGNLAVTPGHVLEFSATKAASGANLVELVVELEFEQSEVASTSAFSVLVPPGAATLRAVKLSAKTTIATSDTNYWTFALTNKGAAGDGTTPMLAATDANTTKATGGSALTGYVARSLTLHGTAGNLAVTPGHVLELTMTKTAAAAAIDQPVVELQFEAPDQSASNAIGLGVSTTKIYFYP